MKYLLDTDICVYWLRGNENVERSALAAGLEELAISFITLSELYYGAYKSKRIKENLAAIQALPDKVAVLDSDEAVCEGFGKLKAGLEKEGSVIEDADLFVAACALSHDITLVTNNEKHFRKIKGLNLENWLR